MKRKIDVNLELECPECGGDGGSHEVCSHCNGYGRDYVDTFGTKHHGEKCPFCDQDLFGDTTGIIWRVCEECDGEGFIIEEDSFDLVTLGRLFAEVPLSNMSDDEVRSFVEQIYRELHPYADVSVFVYRHEENDG